VWATLMSDEARRLRAQAYATADIGARREALARAKQLSDETRRMTTSTADFDASRDACVRAALMLEDARRMRAHATAAVEAARRTLRTLERLFPAPDGQHAIPRSGLPDDGLTSASDLTALTEVLDAAISLTRAAMGNIQLLNPATGTLRIAVQRGFRQPFLDFFACVDDGQAACGTALQRAERIVVEEVAESAIFAGTPALDVLLDAGARAVQSTPIFDGSGRVRAMLSTHYGEPRRLKADDLQVLDSLARRTAEVIDGWGQRVVRRAAPLIAEASFAERE